MIRGKWPGQRNLVHNTPAHPHVPVCLAPLALLPLWPQVGLLVLALGLLVGAAVPLTLGLVVGTPVFQENMPGGAYRADGLFNPPGNVQGFDPPQTLPDGTTVRAGGSYGTITFPYAAQVGRQAQVRLRLAADPAQGASPVAVTVRLNGAPATPFAVTREFAVYTASVDTARYPNPYLDPAHVQVDLLSTTAPAPQTAAPRGVMVDWVRLKPGRSAGQILSIGVVGAGALLGVLLVALARLGLVAGLAYGGLALASFAVLQVTYMPRAIPPATEVALAGLAWLLAGALAPRARPAWGLGLVACGLAVLVLGRLMGDWQMDDAYISYRYAWNLVQGQGLVYNPGEVVEGYTNFLWTLPAAGAIALGLPPAGVTLAANIALTQGLVALTYYLTSRLAGALSLWPLLTAGLLTIDDSLVTYGARGSGMEATLLALWVLLGAACLWAGAGRTILTWRGLGGLALALAALTRPEGLLVAAIFLGLRTLQDWQSGQPVGRGLRAALVPFLALVGPYQVWRIGFYGDLFPNTFYAKTGATVALLVRGLDHCVWFVREHWLLVVLAGLGLGLAAWEWRMRRIVLSPGGRGFHRGCRVC